MDQDADCLIGKLCDHIGGCFVDGYTVAVKGDDIKVREHRTATCWCLITQRHTESQTRKNEAWDGNISDYLRDFFQYWCVCVCVCGWASLCKVLTWTIPFRAALVSIHENGKAQKATVRRSGVIWATLRLVEQNKLSTHTNILGTFINNFRVWWLKKSKENKEMSIHVKNFEF